MIDNLAGADVRREKTTGDESVLVTFNVSLYTRWAAMSDPKSTRSGETTNIGISVGMGSFSRCNFLEDMIAYSHCLSSELRILNSKFPFSKCNLDATEESWGGKKKN